MKLFRADNLIDLQTVENTTIAFLGQGSLGSLTTSLLAYPWGRIILIDPDELEDKNVERHLLGYSQIGKFKVEGMREWLVDRGVDPGRIETVTDMSLELEALKDAGILVVSIDDPESCYKINQFAVNRNIPAIYGGVYPNGTGGQVVIVSKPKDACYLCAEKMTGVLDYKGKSPDGDYGVDPMTLVNSAGKLQAVPALKYSIAAIASDMAFAVMDILNGVAEPQILIHAQTWEGILNVRSGQGLNALSGMISAMPGLGLVQNMKLSAQPGGYMFSVQQGMIGQILKRWNVCPAHSSVVSPEDI